MNEGKGIRFEIRKKSGETTGIYRCLPEQIKALSAKWGCSSLQAEGALKNCGSWLPTPISMLRPEHFSEQDLPFVTGEKPGALFFFTEAGAKEFRQQDLPLLRDSLPVGWEIIEIPFDSSQWRIIWNDELASLPSSRGWQFIAVKLG